MHVDAVLVSGCVRLHIKATIDILNKNICLCEFNCTPYKLKTTGTRLSNIDFPKYNESVTI